MDFKVDSKVEEDSLILSLFGELDVYSTPKFKEEVKSAYEENKLNIILDCKNLEYMDSTGLGSLIYLLKIVNEDNKKISIKNLSKQILKLFKITKLDEIFEIMVD
ncbi:STAS domain-containing protein [Peptoniphilus raoultii]|uniref:STAS domain-containing protein n=1 Tax=Peptoniphilus raoultii TaxID=1776387 RepID=UPI0008D95F67|nr:STAS domain-containing protein [Peptoniphilus raoultii]